MMPISYFSCQSSVNYPNLKNIEQKCKIGKTSINKGVMANVSSQNYVVAIKPIINYKINRMNHATCSE